MAPLAKGCESESLGLQIRDLRVILHPHSPHLPLPP